MLSHEDQTQRIQDLWHRARPCILCPRRCEAQRDNDDVGFCGVGSKPVVSSVGPHFGEESVLVGRGGSGTIFFAGCNLGCVFCQNHDISHGCYGQAITVSELAEHMLYLQGIGCCNINFVTPTHFAPALAEAITLARGRGLTLPTVYNCGGYEDVEVLKLLEGFIDIYMPDLKFADPAVSEELCQAPDYPQASQAAIREMFRQVGDLQLANGTAGRGLLVRHLVMPENQVGSEAILDFLADQISPNTAINVMDQYRPCYMADSYPLIARRPSAQEVRQVKIMAHTRGLRVID